ncbi:acyl-CoA synthetase (AMP-forming)/AMP-acid ligase II [Microbacterium sp. AG1240]|uniref:alpha/beta fold hydrolase n=1 Tax=Microbacterium sp. AG1240 TaxID=2183992 RepID=UPI000EAC1FD2|nr:alpha/beta fold hydrolase [Microbacterium sp. AG1240]RKT36363.1 acyl-CoA synthetase (AMP-forming)/AMP-acid ligase II [Microbacterium sp. AG1240]
MSRETGLSATLPPEGLPGLDPALSRVVAVPGFGVDVGRSPRWHVLDTGDALRRLGAEPLGTIIAVHGNPTWSYLWRDLLAASLRQAADGGDAWRIIAVDQLEMGYSERTSRSRGLEQRIGDLAALVRSLAPEGPIVTLGHDWGGPISLGWAVENPTRLAGAIVLNTAVHHPSEERIPFPLRVAGARGVLGAATTVTTAFLDTTLSLADPKLDPAVSSAYRSPYATTARRRGIGEFVADIPATPDHRSTPALERVSGGLGGIGVPALLLRGPTDPVFLEKHLEDLTRRMPWADVHRFEGAGHLLVEERPYAETVLAWLSDRVAPTLDSTAGAPAAASVPPDDSTPLWDRLFARRDDDGTAVIDMTAGSDGSALRVSWRQLADRVEQLAAGFHRMGVRRGDRVSLLVQPGPTLTAVLYACLRIGAVVVVADRGLGIRGLSRAVRGASPRFVVGEVAGLAAARALGWSGIRISASRLPSATARLLGVSHSLADVAARGASGVLPEPPASSDDAAVLFTSGSTGPAKGVVYTHGQLSALRDALGDHFDVHEDSGLVTGFAPFALLGPALGTRSATPEMDVSAPRTLTATAVARAVRESEAKIVFLSPAAVTNVVATSGDLDDADRAALADVRTFLSTGAPVSLELLRAAQRLMPNAVAHTPYGMTECLLVTDITLTDLEDAAASGQEGVCVGAPIGSGRVLIIPLDELGRATGALTTDPAVTGEVVISAPHLKRGYHRLWATDREATRDVAPDPTARWHRTGDVGHLDENGRLWIEGRMPHVIATSDGPVTPVGAEQSIERVHGVARAAVVGVGPEGLRQCVAVIETTAGARRAALADPSLTEAIRKSTDLPIAAVLQVRALPTDVRHNSKIDRSRLSAWAEGVLSGRTPSAP